MRIDPNTIQRSYGLFTRILVDVDLSVDLPAEIVIKRNNGESFVQAVAYEKISDLQRRKRAASQVYVPKQREGKEILVDSSPSTRIDYGEGPSFAQKSPVQVQEGVECDKTVDVELEETQLQGALDANNEVVQVEDQNVLSENIVVHEDAQIFVFRQDEAESSDLKICVSANEQHVVHESVPAKVKVSEEVDEASSCLDIQPGGLPSSLKGYFQIKIFYWNLWGIANDPTQDLLRKFVRDHHFDVLCIAEPFVSLDSIPSQFWLSMNLVEVSTNDRGVALPTLWMFCKPSLLHAFNVVSRTVQQVTVTVTVTLDSVQCVLTSVYARTTMEGRRCLWIDLASVKENFVSGPWLVFGDFNTTLGAYEKKGGAPVCRRSCEEFQAMTDVCELIHVATRGA
ncbi:hypothetical protein ACLB2K_049987 [Fragaria x ananassa]